MVEPSFGACHARNEIMFAMRQHDATGNVTRCPTSAENCGGTVSRRWWTEFRCKLWTTSIVIIRDSYNAPRLRRNHVVSTVVVQRLLILVYKILD